LSGARIPVAGPWITQREIDYVTDAAANAWYADAGRYNDRFERAFAKYLGVAHAISLPSCTSAIHLSLLCLGVGPGDEVIVPDVTWIASAAPVSYVGAEPVFADVDESSWCLSAEALESVVTPRTRAVIVVDLYGNMPDMGAIQEVAERHDLAVIEDAAEAVGSECEGRRAGSFGATGVFSFHGSKTLTTGEGGLLATDRDDIHERALCLRDHGRAPGDTAFFNREVAYKYKMSALQAALGLAQLERIEELIARKLEIFGWYEEELSDCAGVTLNRQPPRTKSTYWMVTALVDPSFGLTKEALMPLLAQQGVDSRPFFHPLSSIPAYRETEQAQRARQRNAVSYRLSPYGVNLPSALLLTRDDVHRACSALRSALEGR
jgi:perosamine synthetase